MTMRGEMMRERPTSFDAWVSSVPASITGDTLWRMEAYRLSLFLADLAWIDADHVIAVPKCRAVADQLHRATSKISACIAEGYSRNTGKARAVYYEYAIGSARESRDWYYKLRGTLAPDVIDHRLDLCVQVIRLALTMCANERRSNRKVDG